MRKIHIDEKVWEYKIGKSHVEIRDPNNKKFAPDFSKVTGLDWDTIERGQWEGYFSIKPHMIKNYIEENIIK